MAPRVLIVDEAFADFDAADESLAPDLPERGAIVLRSFGKTYGLAGLRLGFAIAPPDLAGLLRVALGPWAVSGPAIEVGLRALPDEAWFEAMRARVKAEAERLDRLLMAAGWTVIGGTRLFRLASRADAAERFAALLGAGILTRPFAEAPDRLRFGLPADEADGRGWRWGWLEPFHGAGRPARRAAMTRVGSVIQFHVDFPEVQPDWPQPRLEL